MHFTKFLTVSQLHNNAQIIAQHLKKPLSSPKENNFESQSPRLRKKPSNTFVPTINTQDQQQIPSPQNNLFQIFASSAFQNSGLAKQLSPQNRGLPMNLEQQRKAYGNYNKHHLRKHSQNNIIYENEQAQKEDEDQVGLKPWPIKGSQATQPRFHLKDRKSSCNLQALSFFKNINRKNSDQSSQLNSPKRQRILVKKKSLGWDQNKQFQFGSSNPASEDKSQGQNLQNLLPQPPTTKIPRKKSENTESPKKVVPSFLINPKHHRNSVDIVDLNHKKKLTIQDFIIIKQLGKGSFGRVVLAAQKQSRMICAIKIMSKRELRENNMIDQLVRELKIQILINHPNIVKIHGFFDDLLHFYILIECALDGHLSQFIKKTTSPIPQIEAGIMMHQICQAVSLLHSQSIIHRDLKPQNVLLHEGVVKICDFGWSVRRDGKLRTTFCGTPVYLCPQILIGDEYDESVDIWTIGIILYEMIYKTNPFRITAKEDLINILNSPIDFKQHISISKTAKDFIQICLNKRAAERPNIRELLFHQFILKAQSIEEQRQKN